MAEDARGSLIIPSWNGAKVMEANLRSLLPMLPPEHEVIVVVNASTDHTADVVQSFAQSDGRVREVLNSDNRGFAGAVNQGLALARGELVILLNQDTLTERDWISPLFEAALADPLVGAIGCKLRFPDGRVQHAGGYVNTRGEGSHFDADPPNADAFGLCDVDFVTGAAMALTRRAVEAVGGFDEDFGLAYFEDVDWCYRARESGFRVVYCQRSELIHLQESASGGLSFDAMYRYHHNRLRFVLKHFPAEQFAGQFMRDECAWLHSLGPGGESLLAAMQRVYVRHLNTLPRTLNWRSGHAISCDDMARIENARIEDALIELRSQVSMRPARVAPR